jgi:protein-S-isoprenylcysteine O-methyltransferase Ste14
MWARGFLKVCAATVIYGLVHSALASRKTKQTAREWIGPRYRNALYRPFYLLQSLVTMFLLVAYIRRQPGKTLYHIHGSAAVPFRLGQWGGIVWAVYGAYEVGLLEILGIRPLWQLLLGEESIAPEPEAQGPSLNAEGALRIKGPFRYSRHPLNLVPFIILWLNPRQTTNLLAYNAVSTIYLILGSIHEESRLRTAYGDAYRQYEKGPVPFYFPKLPNGTIS